jgi:transposase-like protein
VFELWFTEKDIRQRWSEVKGKFWEEFEEKMNLAAKLILEKCLRAERSLSIGAGHYRRSKERLDQSNGYYSRNVVCKLGVLTGVLFPRSRRGVYKSQILKKYKRFGGDFDRYILKMFTLGLSTRRVEEFFVRFFGERAFSSQTVSEILREVDGELREFHKRPLSDKVSYLYKPQAY